MTTFLKADFIRKIRVKVEESIHPQRRKDMEEAEEMPEKIPQFSQN